MTKEEFQKGEIVIYKSPQNEVQVEVRFEKETVWLRQEDIAKLFNKERSVITKHINRIFADGEVDKKSNVQKMHIAGSDRPVNFYNLVVILAVGYRVHSARAIHFRQWATKILKDYLLKGYAINEKRLLETQEHLKELHEAISFLQEKSQHQLLAGQEQEILNLLAHYSRTLTLLEQYDKDKLLLIKETQHEYILTYEDARKIIETIKNDLIKRKEASNLFGQENSESFKGIIGNIYQTFDNQDLYPSLEEKAAHLLYFIIKDHPFVDGKKRIASFLFAYYIDKNNFLYRHNGEKKINDNALTALSLLIAISNSSEKEKLIKIVTNLPKP